MRLAYYDPIKTARTITMKQTITFRFILFASLLVSIPNGVNSQTKTSQINGKAVHGNFQIDAQLVWHDSSDVDDCVSITSETKNLKSNFAKLQPLSNDLPTINMVDDVELDYEAYFTYEEHSCLEHDISED